MKFTREDLYSSINKIFSCPMDFVEQNKDGIIFADENGTQFQIKVTQKKTKVSPITTDKDIVVAKKSDWEEFLKMSEEEMKDYFELMESLTRGK
jgi:hypothetical protein